MVRVAINGFGRIGRLILRAAYGRRGVDVVAINDLGSTKALAYLLKYDSAHQIFDESVASSSNKLKVGKKTIEVFSERDPKNLPWKKINVDVVLECTGFFLTEEKASLHLEAGAKKVILSAPAKEPHIKTIVMGVNEKSIQKKDLIISNASCTTNCLGPLIKVLDDEFGVKKGFMSTTHSVTASQRTVDGVSEKDLRRGRSALQNMIPTSTGAAKAIGEVLPNLKGKIDGMAVRVPIITGSITDATLILNKIVTADDINRAYQKKSKSMKGILQCSNAPIVSTDIIGNSHSCIIDMPFTKADKTLVKVLAWYDNEWGYSNRMVDLVEYISKVR